MAKVFGIASTGYSSAPQVTQPTEARALVRTLKLRPAPWMLRAAMSR